jgi:hypothetical protein
VGLGRALRLEPHALGLGAGREPLHHLVDEVWQVGGLELERKGARLDLGQLEEIVDQSGEPVPTAPWAAPPRREQGLWWLADAEDRAAAAVAAQGLACLADPL